MPPETARAGGRPAPADHGLFGPASVTWRVMPAPVLWTAALRALHAGASNGPGDRLILSATRAARDQARAVQRVLAARRLTAVP